MNLHGQSSAESVLQRDQSQGGWQKALWRNSVGSMSENHQERQTSTRRQRPTSEVPADGVKQRGGSQLQGFLDDPWVQAGVTGALVLVPARKYPRWLWQGLTWGSTAAVVGVALLPGATTKLLEFSARHFGPEDQEQELSEVPEPGPVLRTAVALGAGAFMYGSWRFSLWADDAVERGLRRLRVPAPRVVMASGTGAATWYQVDRGNRPGH